MNNESSNLTRRHFLTISATAGLVGLFPSLAYATVIREMKGTVWVNGKRATLQTIIKPGDAISTGANSLVIFVLGEDVYRLGAHSILRLYKNEGNFFASSMRFIAGTFTAAFSEGEKTIITSTAAIGVRGTGLFLKRDVANTYFCTCYGSTEIVTTSKQRLTQPVTAAHHQAYFISDDSNNAQLSPGTLLDHQDQDAIYLEAIVGRRPPATFK